MNVTSAIITTERANGFEYLKQTIPMHDGLRSVVVCDGCSPTDRDPTFTAMPWDSIQRTGVNLEKQGSWKTYLRACRIALAAGTERVLIAQDDALFGEGLAETLEATPSDKLPPIISLFRSAAYVSPYGETRDAPDVDHYWTDHGGWLHGAQAILYERRALEAFMRSDVALCWHLDKGPDLALSHYCWAVRRHFHVVWPSWCQHIGDISCFPDHGNSYTRQAKDVVSPREWLTGVESR